MKTSLIGVGSGVVDAPFSSTSFLLETDYKWLKLTISFSKKGWYSIFVWDPSGNLRVQSLYINEPKEIILAESHDETSFSAIPGLILKGEWKLEILAATYKANPEYKFTFECGQDASADRGESERYAIPGLQYLGIMSLLRITIRKGRVCYSTYVEPL